MNTQALKWTVIAGVCGAALLLPIVSRADGAIVVGVNKYPRLLPGTNLEGAVNDAKAVTQALKKQGFDQVMLLADEQATRQGILNALKQMKAKMKSSDRFVFFFSGHGDKSSDNTGVLLPHDAEQGKETNDLTQMELYQAVGSVPARSRTIMLDSCFSGAMMRALRTQSKTRKSRFYGRNLRAKNGQFEPQKLDREIIEVNDDNRPEPTPVVDGKICYVTAASKYEQAYEDDIDGERHGFFAYSLCKLLNGQGAVRGSAPRWGEVHREINKEVAEKTEDTQHPQLSAKFTDMALFGGKDDEKPKPDPVKKRTVWDDYAEERIDASKLALRLEPNQSAIKVGERFVFNTLVGADGYLILIARDQKGVIQLLYPSSRNIEEAGVSAGKALRFPVNPKNKYEADAEGTQRVKAILFGDRKDAEALIKAFGNSNRINSIAEAKRRTRAINEVADEEEKRFYTSPIGFEVRPK
jgi:hypothetical protein